MARTAPTTETRWLGYAAASEYAGLSEDTLRRLIGVGRLHAYRPAGGRRVLIDRAELDSYIRSCAEGPAPEEDPPPAAA